MKELNYPRLDGVELVATQNYDSDRTQIRATLRAYGVCNVQNEALTVLSPSAAGAAMLEAAGAAERALMLYVEEWLAKAKKERP